MTPRLLRSTIAPIGVALSVVALATAAAPAANGDRPRSSRPRLIVAPSELSAAQAIAPGDRIERLADLRVRGRGRFAAVYFVGRARKSSGLDANSRDGLQIAIDRCSRKWVKRRGTYSCSARRSAVLARRPLLGRTRLRRLRLSHRAAHLRMILTLPTNAGDALQGQSTDAVYSFEGIAAASRLNSRRR